MANAYDGIVEGTIRGTARVDSQSETQEESVPVSITTSMGMNPMGRRGSATAWGESGRSTTNGNRSAHNRARGCWVFIGVSMLHWKTDAWRRAMQHLAKTAEVPPIRQGTVNYSVRKMTVLFGKRPDLSQGALSNRNMRVNNGDWAT